MQLFSSRSSQAGTVSIEMALSSIALAMLTYTGIEFGRVMYTYNQVCQSVRSAGRYLATVESVDANAAAVARNLVAYGAFTNTSGTLVPGLTAAASQIQVCSASYCDANTGGLTQAGHTNFTVTGGGSTNLVTVRVAGLNFSSIAPAVVASFVFRPIQVTLPRAS